MKSINRLVILSSGFFIFGCTPSCCKPAASEPLIIILEDSLGNNLIEQNFSALTLELTDANSTHSVNSVQVSDGTTSNYGWNFNIDDLESGHPYLLEYDSSTVDTLTVNWTLESSNCGNKTYFHRTITSVVYNDTTFYSGGHKTVIK